MKARCQRRLPFRAFLQIPEICEDAVVWCFIDRLIGRMAMTNDMRVIVMKVQ